MSGIIGSETIAYHAAWQAGEHSQFQRVYSSLSNKGITAIRRSSVYCNISHLEIPLKTTRWYFWIGERAGSFQQRFAQH